MGSFVSVVGTFESQRQCLQTREITITYQYLNLLIKQYYRTNHVTVEMVRLPELPFIILALKT